MDHNVDNLIEIEKEIQLKVSESNNIFKIPTIIAVSKTFSISDILPVINYGQIHFGENKIQEAIDKWESIKIDFKHIKLHMVGKLQTNKVKYLIPFFDYLHSDDWGKDFEFVQEVGKFFHDYSINTIKKLKEKSWSEKEKNLQLLKRSRYAEFNLLHDRGTRFGLETGGNIEAILMSMPPLAKWE